jgi:hypothetical protein
MPEPLDDWTVTYRVGELRLLQQRVEHYIDQTRTFATLACPDALRDLEGTSKALIKLPVPGRVMQAPGRGKGRQ